MENGHSLYFGDICYTIFEKDYDTIGMTKLKMKNHKFKLDS